MVFTDLSIDELDDEVGLLMKAFFTPSQQSQATGRAHVERLKHRVADRDALLSKQAAIEQPRLFANGVSSLKTERFAMLARIHHPTLVVHCNKDVVVMPINAFLPAEPLQDAQLIMYPDASHAAQSQYAETFLGHVKLFLKG